jgi:ferredoxin
MDCPVPNCQQREPTALGRKLSRLRPWLQTGFLGVWLAPLGRWLHGIPGCVFHCYSCPLSAFACPVGVAANYSALLPVVGEVPYLLMGLLLLVGAVSGSLVCGWACPFGFLQDLLGKIFPRKISLPGWVGYTRYVVLVGLVLLLPMILGFKGIPFEKQAISICRLCPAGALEAGVPYSVQSLTAGNGWMMSGLKTGILLSFLAAAIFIHRPWCLRFNPKECVECNLCRSRCSMGVKVDQAVNVSGCIRCLECTTCGAIEPCFALPQNSPPDQAKT